MDNESRNLHIEEPFGVMAPDLVRTPKLSVLALEKFHDG